MAVTLKQTNREGQIKPSWAGADDILLVRFTAMERMSEPFTVIADVIVAKGHETLSQHLGDKVSIEVKADTARSRFFHGRLWEVAELGVDAQDNRHYRFTLKPWASFLDINIESRMFQELNIKDITQAILDKSSPLSPKIKFSIDGYPALEYCIQWQESDFDFISRQFERHGLYYHFAHTADDHEMVVTDRALNHVAAKGIANAIEVRPQDEVMGRPGGAVWSLVRRFEVAPVKATVTDYDFTTPTKKLSEMKDGTAKTNFDKAKVSELYVHPGGFTKALGPNRGKEISERLVEAARAESERSVAAGDAFAAHVGATIELKPTAKGSATKYLIIATTHVFSGGSFSSNSDEDELSVEMELIPADVQFRPLLKTPRPRIYGPQTAIVAGKDGEEIDTDEHGRIKVHFHWDREQSGGATSSCWIRVAQSIAGAQWGAFTLPRIGQEVVVEFLGGDPDQPLVTGSVYNGTNKPPYALPANKTRSTFKSRSTPKSSGFNELRMEDKAGSEEVFFNAEKDLNSIIDKGNETRTLNSGNRTTTIKKGNEVLDIDTGNRTDTLKKGNDTLAIKTGNRAATIDMGNDSLTIKMGNQTVKIDMGKQATEAMQSIEFKCGGSSIKLDPMKITLKALIIEVKADMMLKTEAGIMTEQKAGAIHVIKGGVVVIN
jgi:type VI secretion system secreted protein VgrG